LRRIVAAIQRNVEGYAVRVGTTESQVRIDSACRVPPVSATECRVADVNNPDSMGTEQFVGASIPVLEEATELQSSSAISEEDGESGDKKLDTTNHNPFELYDDISVSDEVQVGVYANGLIIGHTDSEFKLDFVSNMFPKSVVTSRIFMSAPQLVRLLDTLERTLQQFDLKRSS